MERMAVVGMAGMLFLLGGCGQDAVAPETSNPPGVLEEIDHSGVVPTGVVIDLHPWVVTDTLVLMRWTEVDDGTGAPADYRLKYSEPPLDDWKNATVGCERWIRGEQVGAFIQCEVAGLEPATAYQFRLMSFRMEDGHWAGARYSNMAETTTLQKRADPVTDLAARDVTDGSMTLAWTQVDDGTGEPAFYRVRYGPAPMVPWRSGTIGCDRTIRGDAIGAQIECTIEGLEPGVTYDALLMSFRLEDGVWVGARYSNRVTATTASSSPSGFVATAAFHESSAETCYETVADVRVTETAGPDPEATLDFRYYVFGICGGQDGLFYYDLDTLGEIPIDPADLIVDPDLKWATLDTEIRIRDGESGTFGTIRVEVTWERTPDGSDPWAAELEYSGAFTSGPGVNPIQSESAELSRLQP